ncbi:hypothetical protein C8J56DRAFT_897773 [Mycena floridula]|nr:hypothetical protein C8J56DRAFT_897773 [Mycena floridula]
MPDILSAGCQCPINPVRPDKFVYFIVGEVLMQDYVDCGEEVERCVGYCDTGFGERDEERHGLVSVISLSSFVMNFMMVFGVVSELDGVAFLIAALFTHSYTNLSNTPTSVWQTYLNEGLPMLVKTFEDPKYLGRLAGVDKLFEEEKKAMQEMEVLDLDNENLEKIFR